MTALIFSLLFIAYVVIPGIIVRRLFSFLVPLRKFQWTRTEEVTSSVIACLVPFIIAVVLVRYSYWFGHHPFAFDDSVTQKWSDYKNGFSASYSDKFFLDNREAVWEAVWRIVERQCRLLVWFYSATSLVTVIMAITTFYYGNLRKFKVVSLFVEKLVIPSISEWYAMLRPFTFPRTPKRKVMVDVLTAGDKLYQGEVGDYHVDRDSHLTGILIKNTRRFDRDGYNRDRSEKKAGPTENYWRKIPGDTLYMLADKILNLNINYVPEERLDSLAEKNLKKLNIDAHVTIEAPITTTIQTKVEEIETEPSTEKNFLICPHCNAHGLQRRIVRATEQTPLVSRSDGRNYHLFLQYGPGRRPSKKGSTTREEFITHFRYALESEHIANDPVVVVLKVARQNKGSLNDIIEEVADKLATHLEEGEKLAPFYNYQNERLSELPRKR
jgi:hypothetical protein